MKILAIDYGLKKIGLAVGEEETGLAEPFGVLRVNGKKQALNELKKIISKNEIDCLVVGLSEGKMSEITKHFAKELKESLNIKLVFEDETLTTYEAQKLSREANLRKFKRRKMEDAFAASLILERYFQRRI
jgi:putative Holliday junction resolvase